MVMLDRAKPQFDVNEFLAERRMDRTSHPTKTHIKKGSTLDFKALVKQVSKFFHEKIEDPKLTDSEREERQKIEHEAMLGDVDSKEMLLSEIESFLREHSQQSVTFPSMYPSLAQGIFEQIFRFKEFYKWELYPDSVSAKIAGTEIHIKRNGRFEKQQEQLESEEDVYEIIRMLQQADRKFHVSEQKPEGETGLRDGTRIVVTIPPLTAVPTIVFRRFIVNKFSFEQQAKMHTIDEADIPIFKLLAQTRLNTIIAGHVESGKSTMLKTFYAERPRDLIALLIEETRESYLKRDFPDRLVHEFSAPYEQLWKTLRTILRFDHHYVIFQEVRGAEADAAIEGASRGSSGLLMTYHVTDPSKVVEQLAQHIVDALPNRRMVNESRRVAQTLHLGVTMESDRNNIKRVTSVYEVCYDFDTDEAWVNYLIKFDEATETWRYNAHISENILKELRKQDNRLAEELQHLLKQRAASAPLADFEAKRLIYFK